MRTCNAWCKFNICPLLVQVGQFFPLCTKVPIINQTNPRAKTASRQSTARDICCYYPKSGLPKFITKASQVQKLILYHNTLNNPPPSISSATNFAAPSSDRASQPAKAEEKSFAQNWKAPLFPRRVNIIYCSRLAAYEQQNNNPPRDKRQKKINGDKRERERATQQ